MKSKNTLRKWFSEVNPVIRLTVEIEYSVVSRYSIATFILIEFKNLMGV